ncbi:MAG: hypothetical protein ACE37F_24505 [Nannocystaceae bacterium]|nr:hypothetical protein [bacterium]
MPSLPQVLHEASIRGATEVTLESDQHPMVKTDAGSVTVGDPLSESELFDALALVLGPDQQAELALGNTVSFNLDVGGQQWGLVAEPALDGILVRGRASTVRGSGPADEDEAGASSGPIDLPKLDSFEPDRQTVPSTGKSILRPTKRRTQWDIGVPEAPASEPAAPSPPPSKPSWSKHLGDDAPSDFEIRTPTGEQPANLIDAHDDLVGEALAREIVAQHPVTTTPTRGATEVRPALQDFAASIGPGTLCIVQGEGGAETLAAALGGGDYALIDDPTPDGVLQAAAELDIGARFAVRLEDPSAVLGWILRRLEEGARVVVQTRARTGPGARRILLGTGATERAEQWLGVHPMLFFADEDSGWTRYEF